MYLNYCSFRLQHNKRGMKTFWMLFCGSNLNCLCFVLQSCTWCFHWWTKFPVGSNRCSKTWRNISSTPDWQTWWLLQKRLLLYVNTLFICVLILILNLIFMSWNHLWCENCFSWGFVPVLCIPSSYSWSQIISLLLMICYSLLLLVLLNVPLWILKNS